MKIEKGLDFARAVLRFVEEERHRARIALSRILLLHPNRGSDLKIERYTFSASVQIAKIGTEQVDLSGVNSPDVNFRPQRITTNMPAPGMVYFTDARVANVSFIVGGVIDAWQWNPNSVGETLDVPTLTPANRMSFNAFYTGRVPSEAEDLVGKTYLLVMSATGPASIVT